MSVTWVVSKGSYSDYRVLAAFDSKTRAKAAADTLIADPSRWGDARVESLAYFDRDPQRVVVYGCEVVIMDSGTEKDRHQTERTEWEHDALYPEYMRACYWRWVRAPVYGGRGGRLEVHGTDRERVLKVFSEKRAEILADEPLRRRSEAHN